MIPWRMINMIITTHELYDFYYLITVIRNEITDKNNIYILKKLLIYIKMALKKLMIIDFEN